MNVILAIVFVVIEVSVAKSTRRPLPACATVKCAEACLDNPTRCTSKCNDTRPCPGNLGCVNGLCDCPQDTYYKNGRCRPIIIFDPSCAAVQCLKGSVCKDGKCSIPSNKCITVKCRAAYHCVDGRCVPDLLDPSCAAVQCLEGSVCKDGKCSIPDDKCRTAGRCMDAYHCVDGRCVPDLLDPSCAAVQCLEGSVCKDGKCSIPTTTPYDQCIHIKCSAGFYCYQSQCIPNPPTTTSAYDKCRNVKCKPDYICINGKCLAIFTHPTFITDV